ncbi:MULTISPECIES: hypothetical protein [unclassified Acinetobacter]|uniref:hypothetical protein n=1 Tax=unclassified Acinetobacter TaxID=196816 RepID=UPI0035BA9D8F
MRSIAIKQLSKAGLCLSILCASQMIFAQTELKHWSPEQATQLNQFIEKHKNQNEYAVFDMDNTSYQYDLTEYMLVYLEQNKVLTRENLDPALKLIPFKDTATEKESLYSYYSRLCEIDDLVCYPWIAQSFSGLKLKDVKPLVDKALAEQKVLNTRYYSGDKMVDGTIKAPKLFPAMQELYNKLQENGINVYVMTAANEEIARMVIADKKYGYNVKPENVIGVNVLLKNHTNNQYDTSRLQIKRGKYNQAYNMENMQFTSYLMNPMTWFEGKLGSITGWIDQWRKPIMTGGDTTYSDGYMLLNGTDMEKGGLRIWVDRKAKYTEKMANWRKQSAETQQKLGLKADADQGWIVVKPEQMYQAQP